MASPKQIIGAFEDIGEKIKDEIVKTPGDISGRALESIGATSNPQASSGSLVQTILGGGGNTAEGGGNQATTPFQMMNQASSKKVKAAIARSALEYLTSSPKPKEPSIFEKQKKEDEQNMLLEKKNQEQAAKAELPRIKPKPKRGMLFAAKQQSGSETKQNVKSG